MSSRESRRSRTLGKRFFEAQQRFRLGLQLPRGPRKRRPHFHRKPRGRHVKIRRRATVRIKADVALAIAPRKFQRHRVFTERGVVARQIGREDPGVAEDILWRQGLSFRHTIEVGKRLNDERLFKRRQIAAGRRRAHRHAVRGRLAHQSVHRHRRKARPSDRSQQSGCRPCVAKTMTPHHVPEQDRLYDAVDFGKLVHRPQNVRQAAKAQAFVPSNRHRRFFRGAHRLFPAQRHATGCEKLPKAKGLHHSHVKGIPERRRLVWRQPTAKRRPHRHDGVRKRSRPRRPAVRRLHVVEQHLRHRRAARHHRLRVKKRGKLCPP